MAIDQLPMLANPSRPPVVQVVTDFERADELLPAWSGLQERCFRNELMQSPDWLLAWWQTYGGLQERRLRLGLFHEAGRLIGLAPLLSRRCWYGGVLPFRRLELLGSGEPQKSGIYSNHIGILAERGAEARVAARLAQALKSNAFGPWDEIVLPMMSGDTAMPGLLVDAFRAAGFRAEALATAQAPYLALPGSWTDYLNGLTKSGRRSILRALQAFDEWSGGTTRLESIAEHGVEKGREILIRLHHQRWAGEEGAGVFRSPSYLDFHDRIMRCMAARGQLQLLWLTARNEPMAAVYGWVWDNKVYSYQTGRRTDLPARIRPGCVLFAHVIRRSIEQGRRELDLLADDAFYKRQLTSTARPLVRVRAARGSFVEAVRRFGTFSRGVLRQLRRV